MDCILCVRARLCENLPPLIQSIWYASTLFAYDAYLHLFFDSWKCLLGAGNVSIFNAKFPISWIPNKWGIFRCVLIQCTHLAAGVHSPLPLFSQHTLHRRRTSKRPSLLAMGKYLTSETQHGVRNIRMNRKVREKNGHATEKKTTHFCDEFCYGSRRIRIESRKTKICETNMPGSTIG